MKASRRFSLRVLAPLALMAALWAIPRPAQAQYATVGAGYGYPAYTTYGSYGYGYRPYRRAYRPTYYAGYVPPTVYAPRVYTPARYYVAPAPVVVAPPVPAYAPGVYYLPRY